MDNENFENQNIDLNNGQDDRKTFVKIKVIGVGGGGNNAVHSMIKERLWKGIKGVEFICANTDEQVLAGSMANVILPLGESIKGLGAGANPEEGRKAAIESEESIRKTLEGADMVIIAAGMGGGTGTGAAPIIGKVAKELGALTIGIVTTPFSFEGTQRSSNAKIGLKNMYEVVDSLIVVSNNKLLEQFGGISLKDSFIYADKILKQTVRTIIDLIAVPALINLDFADVTTVMKEKGSALIGIGRATGDDRATKAAIRAISSPILEASIFGATHAIINISGGDITLVEASKAVDAIKQAADSDLNIIFGVSVVENLDKDIQVSVIATGLLKDTEISQEELKEKTSQVVSKLNLKFDDENTKSLLIKDPLPEEEKMQISDEIELQNSPFYDSEDGEDDLPSFLKNK